MSSMDVWTAMHAWFRSSVSIGTFEVLIAWDACMQCACLSELLKFWDGSWSYWILQGINNLLSHTPSSYMILLRTMYCCVPWYH